MAKKLLNITEIEDRTKVLVENLNQSTFIVDFVSLFDITKTTITRASKAASDDFIRSWRGKLVNLDLLLQQIFKNYMQRILRQG